MGRRRGRALKGRRFFPNRGGSRKRTHSAAGNKQNKGWMDWLTNKRRKVSKVSHDEKVGVFTKCWNKKVRRPNFKKVRRWKKFASKVRRAVDEELNYNKQLLEYGLSFPISGTTTGTVTARVGWLQLALGAVGDATNTFDDNVNYLQSYAEYGSMTSANPAGLVSCLKYGVADETWTSATGAETTIEKFANSAGLIDSTAVGFKVAGTAKVEVGPMRMHLTLRNPNIYGYWMDIFYVKTRKSVKKGDNYQGPWGTAGTPASNNLWDDSSFIGNTSIELMSQGYQFIASNGCKYHMETAHASPQESRIFNEVYKITKKCRVYLPPGGTIEKALVKKTRRVMTSDYLHRTCVDRGTEWLLIRAVAEVQISTSGTHLGAIPAQDNKIVSGFTGLIGTVSWRMSAKQIKTSTSYDRQAVNALVPVTKLLVGGQAAPTHAAI